MRAVAGRDGHSSTLVGPTEVPLIARSAVSWSPQNSSENNLVTRDALIRSPSLVADAVGRKFMAFQRKCRRSSSPPRYGGLGRHRAWGYRTPGTRNGWLRSECADKQRPAHAKLADAGNDDSHREPLGDTEVDVARSVNVDR